MRKVLLALSMMLTSTFLAMGNAQVRDPELSAFFEEQFAEIKKHYPSGAHEWWGDASYQSELDDPSPEGMRDSFAYHGRALQGLLSFDYNSLSIEDQISFDLFRWEYNTYGIKNYYYRNHYTLNHLDGPSHLYSDLFTRAHTVASVKDAEAYLERLSKMETYLENYTEQIQSQAEAKFLAPAFVYPKAIRTIQNLLKGAPFDGEGEHPVFADFSRKVRVLDIPKEQEEDLVQHAREHLLGSYQRGALKLMGELQRQEMMADSEAGVWRFPNGDEFYAFALEMHTSYADLSADDIHEIGLREVERIHGDIREIMKQVEFDGTLQEFFHFMRTDDRSFYPDTEEGRQQLLSDAMAYVDGIMPILPKYFNRMPKASLEVLAVEEYREDSAPSAFYKAAPEDGSLPGRYYVNLKSIRTFPKYKLESLTYHEALPGHHFDTSLAREMEDVPSFQNYSSTTAFSEGWGLYAERLGKEMGFFQDPYSDFGRLSYELLRAIRLVVDTGIHAKQWDRQKFVDYVLKNSDENEASANLHFERYTVWPGQATAYMIGMLKILDLRQRAMNALGQNFDIREFHGAVLEHGSVTLQILEQNIDRWIAKKLSEEI